MVTSPKSNRDIFMEWLSNRVFPSVLPEIHIALNDIEEHAKKNRIIKGSLFDQIDNTTIKKIRVSIERSRIFKYTHKRRMKTISDTLSLLLQYSQEKTQLKSTEEKSDNNQYSYDNDWGESKKDNGDSVGFENFEDVNRPYKRDEENRFYHWLKDELLIDEETCKRFVSAIRKAEKFAEGHQLKYCSLYTTDMRQAKSTARLLYSNEDFVRLNSNHKNCYKEAIDKLLIYYGSTKGTQTVFDSEEKSIQENNADIDIAQFCEIIASYFPKGYRMNSVLDFKRLNRYYEETTGCKQGQGQCVIEQILSNYGITYEGRLYMPQAMLSDEVREKVFLYINRCFENGCSVVYYDALFSEFSDEFLDHLIYNANMLKAYLSYYTASKSNEYYLGKVYISKERMVGLDISDEIRQYLIAYHKPISITELCDSLSHLASDRIRAELSSNGEFIRNSKGEYFHVDTLELSAKELEGIAAIIASAVEEHEFISGNELFDAIQTKYPETFEKNADFSMIGWRDVLKYRLGDKFSFMGNIISRSDAALSMSGVFSEYSKCRSQFTLEELSQFADSIGTTIYFDSLYVYALRISHELFVSKSSAYFPVKEIDAVLEIICKGYYMPLKSVTEFATFPDASFPWTEYLLEQYVAYFSEKFRLLHGNYNKNSAVGAIVRKTCQFSSFDELITDVLVNTDIPLQKKEVLDYLAENGYIARRSYTNIEALIINATAKRNQKEKK